MNEHQKAKLDDLLEDYKDAVLKAYGYGKTNFLKMTDAQQAAKKAIFEYFEATNPKVLDGAHMDKPLEFEDLLYSFLDARDDYLNAMATSEDFASQYSVMQNAKTRLYDWVLNDEN